MDCFELYLVLSARVSAMHCGLFLHVFILKIFKKTAFESIYCETNLGHLKMASRRGLTAKQVSTMLEEESGGESNLGQYESDLDIEVSVFFCKHM